MAEIESTSTVAQVEDQIVLACEIPENAVAGATFHVQLDDRFFEVLVPEGAVAGQTIHIVVPAAAAFKVDQGVPLAAGNGDAQFSSPQVIHVTDTSATATSPPADLGVFTQLRLLGDRAVAHAKTLDEQYKITDKVTEITKPAVEKIKSVDEKYKITEQASAIGSTAKAKAGEINERYDIANRATQIVNSSLARLQEFDQNHQVSQRVNATSATVVGYAREIDSKYAVSARAAHIVQAGTAAIISAYNRAVEYDQQHRLSERAAASIAAGATVIAQKVNKYTNSNAPIAPAEVYIENVDGVEPVSVEKPAEAQSL